ncbi:MAG: hypothetical protein M1840_006625 [Geoglossum simile]|nr:MAG: hypothetical protein M1840_006625 [Geoglossum simile]
MLAALEGTITGHESLRDLTGTIQSDVSIGNLMMNEEEDNPSWQSFLIDLDLAIKENRESPSDAPSKTGTRAFMAIGALYGKEHSFMHDLELFFWVLFWICIHFTGPNREGRVVPEFEAWNYEPTTRLAKLKSGTVVHEGDFIKTVEENFTSYYRPLIPWVNRLRKVVFPGSGRWKREEKGLYFQIKAVLYLTEICTSTLQQNFVLTNVDPPESLYTNIPRKSFILKHTDWRSVPYFTLMTISRHLAIVNCFRVPFVTDMGRDALVVDIPVFYPRGWTQPNESLRLCTTHLESLWGGKAYCPSQLALTSALLKGTPTMESKVIAGLVGEDMNAIDRPKHEFHKASDVDPKDVWEDVLALPVPVLKPFQKDFSHGRARGNTWGYQSNSKRERKRMDKFFYTGSIETVTLNSAQDVSGRLGRLGIDLKTEVEVWESEIVKISVVRGKYVEKPYNHCYSEDQAVRPQYRETLSGKELVRRKANT